VKRKEEKRRYPAVFILQLTVETMCGKNKGNSEEFPLLHYVSNFSRRGDVGSHHYAFELRSRKDVDELFAFVQKLGARIVDPPDEYYKNYYAASFLDPDGLKLEGMKYGKIKKKQEKSRKTTKSGKK
jgi:catechol 2,3-dioxygenase-like lactoylglutathione lyase family enzyme